MRPINLVSVSIQDTIHRRNFLLKKQCEQWLNAIAISKSFITLRIVDKIESEKLNKQFRNKIGATNILSFQMNENPIKGDLILCSIHQVDEKGVLLNDGIKNEATAS